MQAHSRLLHLLLPDRLNMFWPGYGITVLDLDFQIVNNG
jgi:hypothetical protein